MRRGVYRLATVLVFVGAVGIPGALTASAPATAAGGGATVHPRLLFSAADVPGLRARANSGGVPSQAWKRLKAKADGHMVRVQPDVVRANLEIPVKQLTGTDLQGFQKAYTLQNEMPTYLIELGLAYQVSGDSRYGRRAIELLKALGDVGWPYWTPQDLGVGDLNEGVGLAFDWTYELMTPAERHQIVSSITAYQDMLFVRTMFEYTNEASEYRTSNWSGVIGGGTGLLLLAIKGEPDAPTTFTSPPGPAIPNTVGQFWPQRTYTFQEYLDKAIVKGGNYLKYGYDANGAGHEGHTYSNYGLKNSVPFARALKREGLGDLIAGQGVLNAARWAAFEQLPGAGQNFVNLNDSGRVEFGVDFESMMFALNPDNGIAQWLWQRTVGYLGTDYYTEPHFVSPVGDSGCVLDRPLDAPLSTAACAAIANGTGDAWALLFYRTPAETPEVDPATTTPLSVHHDALGLIDARTGFANGKYEAVSTFQARRNARTHHFQWDLGHFTLYGYGGRFATDPGSACVACGVPYGSGPDEGYAIRHNDIVIDGSKTTQSNNSRYFTGTTIDDFVNGPNTSLTHADMRYAYSQNPDVSLDPAFAGRDHLFSRVPGRPVVVGIADELDRDGGPHAYTWQMLTDKTNLVRTNGSTFTIRAFDGATVAGGTARNVSPTTTSPAASDPAFSSEYITLGNTTDESPAAQRIYTTTAAQQKLEQITVLALTKPKDPVATVATLRLNGANAVAVDWNGTREVFLRKVRSASSVSGEVQTDARIAKFIKNMGETVMRDGTALSAYGRDYVTVTGSAARVIVSGNEVQAQGAAGNSYTVYAPQTVSSVKVNGTTTTSCRTGDYLTFPCAPRA